MIKTYINKYFDGAISLINKLDKREIEKTIIYLQKLKKRKGRLFLLGIGGSAANCSHAVNDFRKICNIETYTPLDNISELTARINDEGWETIFSEWLRTSNLNANDVVMVFSVGGGNMQKKISVNIIKALKYAKKQNSTILGIVSRDGGYTKKVADECILIPVISAETVSPFAEAFQTVVWHLIVNYPGLRVINKTPYI